MSKLLETLLKSEFKFGFELEAYVSDNALDNYDENRKFQSWEDSRLDLGHEENDEDNENEEIYLDDADYEEENDGIDYDALYTDLAEEFSKTFGDSVGVEGDGSLGYGGFEFPSPVMNLTPLNIKKCIEFLDGLKDSKFKIYTDDTCGFHTHISFPKMSDEDMVWVVCHMAIDKQLQDELTSFKTTTGEEFDFFGNYASGYFLVQMNEAIKNQDWEQLSKLISTDKYRVIRMHPQGTLEWRGPRDFLDRQNKQIIKEFFIKLSNLVLKIAKIMDKKDIEGISRQNFFQLVKVPDLTYASRNMVFPSDNQINAIMKNPLILTKVNWLSPWKDTLETIKERMEENGSSFENFLVPLRYKEFRYWGILADIISLSPSFINYVDTDNKELFDYLQKMKHYVLDTFLNINIDENVVLSYLKYCTGRFFQDFLAQLQHRVQANKNVNSFLTPKVGKALKNRFNQTQMQLLIQRDMILPEKIKERLLSIIS